MRRRELITLLGGVMASWPLAVGAQQTSKLPSLGFLTAGRDSPGLPALLEGLGQFGWIESKTIAVEYRYAENRNDRLPELAAELVRLNTHATIAAWTRRKAAPIPTATYAAPRAHDKARYAVEAASLGAACESLSPNRC
jgi:putative tryptophan/tyrosine transport system substrate-binding protein